MGSIAAPALLAAVLELTGAVGTHDPTIVKEGSQYYRFQTGPGIPIAVSNDLKDWTMTGSVFQKNPGWTAKTVRGSTDFWAPEIVFRNGQWRVYYSVSTFGSQVSAIGLATSPTLDPRNSGYGWQDEGVVITSGPKDDFNAIDPAVITDADGNDWLLWGSFWGGLKMRRLDNATGKPLEGSDKVYTIADRKVPPNSVEGGYILAKDGWYYLFASFDFCCRGLESTYKMVVGRSQTITGPYLDQKGRSLLAGGGTVLRDGTRDKRYAAMGHNSIFTEGEDHYLVYHAYDKRRDGAPILAIEKLLWDEQGWPVSPGQLLKTQK